MGTHQNWEEKKGNTCYNLENEDNFRYDNNNNGIKVKTVLKVKIKNKLVYY